MSFALGWPLLLLAGIAGIAIVRRESDEWKQWFAFFAGATFILCFLMTQRAHALWDAIPQVQYIAFPWLPSAPATFCLALLTAAIVFAINRLPARWQNAAYAAVIASVVLSGLPHAKPVSDLSLDETLWTPHDIAEYNVVAATFDTFEPRWVQLRPTHTGGRILVLRGNVTATIAPRPPTRFAEQLRATTLSDIELPLAYFPGWHLRLDGVEQPVDTPSPMGRMRLSVAPGTHEVEALLSNALRSAGSPTSPASPPSSRSSQHGRGDKTKRAAFPAALGSSRLERATGLEPATSTLARLHSTN